MMMIIIIIRAVVRFECVVVATKMGKKISWIGMDEYNNSYDYYHYDDDDFDGYCDGWYHY